jgi:serine/threonine protein kinase
MLCRWYRAPECLLTDGYYNYKMDMWGVGCVFFEIVSLFPLFPGTNELDQIQKIHNILGTPPQELLAKMKKRSQHMDFNFPAKVSSPSHCRSHIAGTAGVHLWALVPNAATSFRNKHCSCTPMHISRSGSMLLMAVPPTCHLG